LGALLLALGKGRLSWAKLWQVLVETGHVTVAILFLLVAANMYSRMLAMSGVTGFIGSWFGLVTVIAIEVGLITPPLGIAAFVVKSTPDDQRIGLNEVFMGALPYVLMMIIVLVLVVIFPQISLVLV
jgi:C4-dicarboxylate transporter, DctM subunit